MKTHKIIILGDSGCGKTSLLYRYSAGHFYDSQSATIGIDFKSIVWHPDMIDNTTNDIKHNNRANFQIWDTAGTERYFAITQNYCKNAVGAVIVFDLTRPKTTSSLSQWIDLCYTNNIMNIIIMGNKNDKIEEIPDFGTDGSININKNPDLYFASLMKLITKSYGHEFFITSAKTGYNVEKAFNELFNNVYKKYHTEIITNEELSDSDDISVLEDEELILSNNSSYSCNC